MTIPGLEAGRVEGGGHLAVAVGALLAEDRHRDLLGAVHDVFGGRLGPEAETPRRRPAVGETALFLGDMARVGLPPVELERRPLPEIAERAHILVEDLLAVDTDPDSRFGGGAADGETRHVVFQKDRHGVVEIVLVNLEHETELFGEERRQGLAAGGRERDIESAVPGKGHLEQGGRPGRRPSGRDPR